LLVLLLATGSNAEKCPFLRQQPQKQALNFDRQLSSLNHARTGDGGVPAGGYEAVQADLITLYTNSQAFFPADFQPPIGPNYGGLFIRLAWHCLGSYRESDGRGGCDGARQRFLPEMDWPDNADLDMARALLVPIKEKYGSSLSWGDLIVLAGTTAIENMGGPVFGFCGGRIDEADGSESLKLGPSVQQEEIGPCQSLMPSLQGQCLYVNGTTALGVTTVGLIYVNPAGPVDHPGDPIASAMDIRMSFATMGFDDQTSVALIGGGHAFGKAHGACLSPPCGEGNLTGIGTNRYTSGFEGSWTTNPTTWTNDYFNNLFDYNWTIGIGPGGKIQWAPDAVNNTAPPNIFMLTTDIALSVDELYKPISKYYAANLTALSEDFARAWYKLAVADMGPVSRCMGDQVPAAQDFQFPLPNAPTQLPDFIPVRASIQSLLDQDEATAAAFINLAYRCAFTYRATDYLGGCNGARIRFSPESDWPENVGTAQAVEMLSPLKEAYPDVSYADLIVLAGQTAIEANNSNLKLMFCGGRVDASDAAGTSILAPRTYIPALVSVRDDFQVKGLTPEQGVALAARGSLSNQYFQDLMDGKGNFSADELALLEDEFGPIVAKYAEDEETFLKTFAAAWTKMMTADRFLNYRENVCTGVDTPTIGTIAGLTTNLPAGSTASTSHAVAVLAFIKTGVLAAVVISLF
jgi:catalase-peroxidase